MKFKKRPVVIEAVQFDGSKVSTAECLRFGGHSMLLYDDHMAIKTLEGIMRVDTGDWIIKGVSNECYPCKDLIFRATYDPVKS